MQFNTIFQTLSISAAQVTARYDAATAKYVAAIVATNGEVYVSFAADPTIGANDWTAPTETGVMTTPSRPPALVQGPSGMICLVDTTPPGGPGRITAFNVNQPSTTYTLSLPSGYFPINHIAAVDPYLTSGQAQLLVNVRSFQDDENHLYWTPFNPGNLANSGLDWEHWGKGVSGAPTFAVSMNTIWAFAVFDGKVYYTYTYKNSLDYAKWRSFSKPSGGSVTAIAGTWMTNSVLNPTQWLAAVIARAGGGTYVTQEYTNDGWFSGSWTGEPSFQVTQLPSLPSYANVVYPLGLTSSGAVLWATYWIKENILNAQGTLTCVSNVSLCSGLTVIAPDGMGGTVPVIVAFTSSVGSNELNLVAVTSPNSMLAGPVPQPEPGGPGQLGQPSADEPPPIVVTGAQRQG